MSSREVFFLKTSWLHIKLYFLHFGSRPYNLSFFPIKVLKVFWQETSWKWNLLCIWLETKLRKQIFLLLKPCVKYTVSPYLTWLFFSNFIKKTMEHFFLGFWNEIFCNYFNFVDFFSQLQQSFWYLLFPFLAYIAIDSNKRKK